MLPARWRIPRTPIPSERASAWVDSPMPSSRTVSSSLSWLEQDDLNMTGMRVAVNVDERFLHDAKQCEARPLVERRCIEIAFKNCPNTGSAFESADQSL